MPQGKELTEIEVRKMRFLRGTGLLIRHNVREIRRSKTAVENVITRGMDGSVQKRHGAKLNLSQRDQRRIIRRATFKIISSAEIF